jgi:predicted Zn-dependent protease
VSVTHLAPPAKYLGGRENRRGTIHACWLAAGRETLWKEIPVHHTFRSSLTVVLIGALLSASCGGTRRAKPDIPLAPEVFNPLIEEVRKPYVELFRIAPALEYSASQIQRMREYLGQAKDYCVGVFEQHEEVYDKDLEAAQRDLQRRSAKLNEKERHDLHCNIQNLRALRSQAEVLSTHAIPVAYENKQAKLDLIEQWPGQLKEIQQQLADGSHSKRRWADVQDIGFRKLEPDQKDDIKDGEEAVRQMRMTGLLPPEVENKAVVDYVKALTQKVARATDSTIPIQVTVLNSKEVNAFALPGGFLFVQRGLLEAAEDESQLVGVIAHEIAHSVARHGHKLMTRATIASIIFQAAQVAAIILTGGAASIGLYYALQYGFYGLGLALNLQLLGVSREFELEADQLGVQYSWNSGYDPSGFIRFFDRMATREGYVNGASWFRTHPPFYQRMVESQREITFLPRKDSLAVQSTEFQAMKKELALVTQKAKEDEEKDGKRPSLLSPEQGCPAPEKIEYKPGDPIETLCSQTPLVRTASR